MEEVTDSKKGISIIGAFGLAVLIVLLEIILFIPIDIISLMVSKTGFNGIDTYIYTIGEILVNIVIILLFIKKIRKKQEFSLKLKYKPNIREYMYALLFLLSHLLIFSNTIGILIQKIEVSEWLIEAIDDMLIDPIIAFISLCVIAPVFEEIIYRGIILEQLSKRYSDFTSIMVSGLIFGLIHANIHQGVNAFFIGLIIGFIYIKTNSLILCMFWHFMNNFLVFISSMNASEVAGDTAPAFSIVQLTFGIILLIASYRFFNRKDDETELAISDI